MVLRDELGNRRMTVSAPLAYTPRGMPIGLRLEARGEGIALYADPIDEPVMIDPLWTNVAPLGNTISDHVGMAVFSLPDRMCAVRFTMKRPIRGH